MINLGYVALRLNPVWTEWLMGFPMLWTVSRDWETLSSRRSANTSAD